MGGLACKTKIILDGDVVADAVYSLCERVKETPDEALDYDEWVAIVKHINAAEESVFKAHRAFLEALGFTGPWPKALT